MCNTCRPTWLNPHQSSIRCKSNVLHFAVCLDRECVFLYFWELWRDNSTEHIVRGGETDTHTHTDRQTDIHTDRQIGRQTETDRRNEKRERQTGDGLASLLNTLSECPFTSQG